MRHNGAALAPDLFGGVAPDELAATYGTPLLVIDGARLGQRLGLFAAAGRRFGFEVSYAAKALMIVAIARRVADAGLGIDVCSLGELATAERALVAPARLTLHGCGKTEDELRAACAGRVGRIVVDGLEEIARLGVAARSTGCAAGVLLRVNTGLEAHTHEYVRTGGENSKFGIPTDGLAAAVEAVIGTPGLRLLGVHSHIGSQILDAEAFVQNVPLAFDASALVLSRAPAASTLVLGGGFGVESDPVAPAFDLETVLATLARTVAREAAGRGVAVPQIGLEPGRAIVAEAGTSLYRVLAIKQNGSRRFAIVDGSVADNPRPALYGAYHHPQLVGRAATAAVREFAVCGRSCESDRLVDASLPDDLRAGDLLALGTTGAYTYSMASNYNRFFKPAVVMAENGSHRPIVRRETLADILACDLDLPA